jgi:hypothetical protein
MWASQPVPIPKLATAKADVIRMPRERSGENFRFTASTMTLGQT